MEQFSSCRYGHLLIVESFEVSFLTAETQRARDGESFEAFLTVETQRAHGDAEMERAQSSRVRNNIK